MSTHSLWLRMISGLLLVVLGGCGQEKQKERDFFTSGSKEADQRADQRMAQDRQLKGGGESKADSKNPASEAEAKKSLYDRLGGEQGLTEMVDDFITRAFADPRVNWERKGVKRGGMSLKRGKSVEWSGSAENVQKLKLHMVQFLSLATGGPSKYDGGEMKHVHAGLHITNPEFDATIGDLKATLDKMQIPNQEQKELLAIIESTRPQVVEER